MSSCLRLLISGRVQGVWFRESMRRRADELGVTGWVRNLADGRVEAVVCGSTERIDALLAWAHKGPPLARVDKVERHPVDHAASFGGFEKRA